MEIESKEKTCRQAFLELFAMGKMVCPFFLILMEIVPLGPCKIEELFF